MTIRDEIRSARATPAIRRAFSVRLAQGNVSREEDPLSHFCVYFAAYDPNAKEVFIGHHRRSGLWLFNGGHMEKDELPADAVRREIGEEWGIPVPRIPKPALLTLTKIEHPETQICEWHYDMWYFMPVDKNAFDPDPKLLAKEFHQIGWKTFPQARLLVRDPSTITALRHLAR